MKKWQRQFLNWLAVILWLGVIYYFSSQPELKSQLEPFIDLICRKIAHMAEFFVLAYLFFRALLIDLNFKKALIISVILSILSAFFDEWHQQFVFGRSGNIYDVSIDSIGILVFIVLNFKYGKNLSYQ